MSRAVLSDAWRFFLETGQYSDLRQQFPDISGLDRVHIFQMGNPACREKLRVIWTRYRDEVLADWKLKKRKGLPWAERIFKNE